MPEASRLRTWLVSVGITLLVLLALFWFADWQRFESAIASICWPVLLGGIVLLQFEGVCTAMRVRLLAGPDAGYLDSFAVTAWWVFGLTVLPARLGEISGMHVFCRRLRQSLGAAVNGLLVQRLLDATVLVAAGILALAMQSERMQGGPVLVGIAAAGALLVLCCIRLDLAFAFASRLLLHRRGSRIGRRVLAMTLGGRRAARSLAARRAFVPLLCWSLGKWLFNLTALTLLIKVLLPALSIGAATAVGVLFNLAAVVPLQTIGGIGIGEAAFVGGFGFYAVDLALAAAVALALRSVLLAAPLVFWGVVIGTERLLRMRTQAQVVA